MVKLNLLKKNIFLIYQKENLVLHLEILNLRIKRLKSILRLLIKLPKVDHREISLNKLKILIRIILVLKVIIIGDLFYLMMKD